MNKIVVCRYKNAKHKFDSKNWSKIIHKMLEYFLELMKNILYLCLRVRTNNFHFSIINTTWIVSTKTNFTLSYREFLRVEASKRRRGIHKSTMQSGWNIPPAGDDSPFWEKVILTVFANKHLTRTFIERGGVIDKSTWTPFPC